MEFIVFLLVVYVLFLYDSYIEHKQLMQKILDPQLRADARNTWIKNYKEKTNELTSHRN